MSDPLNPTLTLLVKLGSISVHAYELLSPNRHQFDSVALQMLLEDPEVDAWITVMTQMALLPVKR